MLQVKALVRPIVEYAAVVWDPLTKTHIHQLEKVQRRAAHFVEGDYKKTSSVSDIITKLQWSSLEERRRVAKASMIYKIINGQIEISTSQLHPLPSATRTRGHQQRLRVPFSRTKNHQQSFFPSATRIWNSLPASIVDRAISLEDFRERVQKAAE